MGNTMLFITMPRIADILTNLTEDPEKESVSRMTDQNRKQTIKTIAVLGILIALTLVMAFTPVGYLKVGAVSISFLMIPVAVGAIAVGPWAGALLGAVFGITSFVQCFGADPFGTFLANTNIVFTFIMCVVCRILAGFLTGLVKTKMPVFVKTAVTGLCAAIFNTVLFVGALILLFGKGTVTEATGIDPTIGIVMLFATIVGINAVFEAIAAFILTGGIGTALIKAKLVKS